MAWLDFGNCTVVRKNNILNFPYPLDPSQEIILDTDFKNRQKKQAFSNSITIRNKMNK